MPIPLMRRFDDEHWISLLSYPDCLPRYSLPTAG